MKVTKASAYLPVTNEMLEDIWRLQRRCFTHTFWSGSCEECQLDASLEMALWGNVTMRRLPRLGRLILLTRDEVAARAGEPVPVIIPLEP